MNNNNYVNHVPCDFCHDCLNYDSCIDKGCLKYCDKTCDCDVLCDNNPCRYYIGGGNNAE